MLEELGFLATLVVCALPMFWGSVCGKTEKVIKSGCYNMYNVCCKILGGWLPERITCGVEKSTWLTNHNNAHRVQKI